MDPANLLLNWGFIKYPFKAYSAEREDDLPSLFIEPPYFNDILGDLNDPCSSIVFGHRGEGKSAICKMIQYELRKSETKKVLVVPYMKFSGWTQREIGGLSLDQHLERILGLSVQSFIQEAEEDVILLENLGSDNRSALQWFVLRFLPAAQYEQAEKKLISLFDRLPQPHRIKKFSGKGLRRIVSFLRRKKFEFEKVADSESKSVQMIRAILAIFGPSIPGATDLRNETMLGLLSKFKDLVVSAGFASIHILVDRVDHSDACGGNHQLVARLVSPIVTSLEFLEAEKIVTKLFLPMQVRDILGGRIRTDIMLTRNISWSTENLRAMLRKRLLTFSGNKIDSLEPFVDPVIWNDFEKKLFYYAALCPRNLIRLIDHVIAELCELELNPSVINKSALDLGIKHFLAVRLSEDDSDEYQTRLRDTDVSVSEQH